MVSSPCAYGYYTIWEEKGDYVLKKIRKKLAEAIDMPESSFGGCPYLALESNTSILIEPCCEILSYDAEEIALRLKEITVTLSGHDLTMRSYGMRTVRIVGTIHGISLSERKREGK